MAQEYAERPHSHGTDQSEDYEMVWDMNLRRFVKFRGNGIRKCGCFINGRQCTCPCSCACCKGGCCSGKPKR